MTPLTREWVQRAEDDFDNALILRRSRKHSRYNGICFFSQQCAEKYLKAVLIELGKPVQRTHDLEALLDAVLPSQPLWRGMRPMLVDLTQAAVNFRYPGTSASPELTKSSFAACQLTRKIVRQWFGLKV